MMETHFSNAGNYFKEIRHRVAQDSDITIITGKNNENVVLMSQEYCNHLMEKLHINEMEQKRSRLHIRHIL